MLRKLGGLCRPRDSLLNVRYSHAAAQDERHHDDRAEREGCQACNEDRYVLDDMEAKRDRRPVIEVEDREVSGECTFFVDNQPRKMVAGSSLYLRGGTMHGLTASGPCVVIATLVFVR